MHYDHTLRSAALFAAVGLTLSLPAVALHAQQALQAQQAQSPKKPPTTLAQLGERLPTEGLHGRVHGAVSQLGTYVFTWWEPGNFFHSFNMSLLPANASVADTLAKLERHQAATIKGKLTAYGNSQPHVVVESVEPGEPWEPGIRATVPSPKRPDVEKELRKRRKISALVHTSTDDGSVLDIEYRDQVVPVQVPPDPALRKQVGALFRGDVVELRYQIAPHPERPMHLLLVSEDKATPALTVVDSLHALHDQERTREGNLVMFPLSPVLRRTIYGIEVKGKDGLNRYLTLFNFNDANDQEKIDQLLRSAWNAEPNQVIDARNKFINLGVKVRASGKISNPARNQANATLVTRSDQIEIVK
jgi:hypothetical protein